MAARVSNERTGISLNLQIETTLLSDVPIAAMQSSPERAQANAQKSTKGGMSNVDAVALLLPLPLNLKEDARGLSKGPASHRDSWIPSCRVR